MENFLLQHWNKNSNKERKEKETQLKIRNKNNDDMQNKLVYVRHENEVQPTHRHKAEQ
jgi:hypothetical protein